MHLQDLANDIEHGFYSRGRQEEIVNEIKQLDPNASIIWGDVNRLEKQLQALEKKVEKKRQKEALIQIMKNDEDSGLYNND